MLGRPWPERHTLGVFGVVRQASRAWTSQSEPPDEPEKLWEAKWHFFGRKISTWNFSSKIFAEIEIFVFAYIIPERHQDVSARFPTSETPQQPL